MIVRLIKRERAKRDGYFDVDGELLLTTRNPLADGARQDGRQESTSEVDADHVVAWFG